MEPGLPVVSFHDAEVMQAVLDHDGPTVELTVEVFAQTPQSRRYKLRFLGVSELDLNDLHTQNVLFDLQAEQTASGRWDVAIDPSVGIGGTIQCAAIEHVVVGRHS